MAKTTRTRHADSLQLVRQWALVRLLAAGARSFSVREIAEQLGASKSTIERDLATLEQHFPLLTEDEGKQKRRYRLATGTATPTMQLGVMELLAAHAYGQSLPGSAGTPIGADFSALLCKLRAALASHRNGGLDQVAHAFQAHPRGYVDYSGHAEALDTLADAVVRQRECRVLYLPGHATEVTDNIVHPLRLLWHQGALYAFCWYAEWRWLGLLAAHRIQTIEPTGKSFEPPRVNTEEIARSAFGIFVGSPVVDVEIHFTPELARHVRERIFHPDEQKEPLPDGGIRYRIRTGARWEVVAFVQRFGGHAELVSPAEWREDVLRGAETMVSSHRSTRGPPLPHSAVR
jgi:predicted DNA-binding transcriptional regulator YafY